MKEGIHPNYTELKATCSCGNVITVGSTAGKDLHLDVCSECHPFYMLKLAAVLTSSTNASQYLVRSNYFLHSELNSLLVKKRLWALFLCLFIFTTTIDQKIFSEKISFLLNPFRTYCI